MPKYTKSVTVTAEDTDITITARYGASKEEDEVEVVKEMKEGETHTFEEKSEDMGSYRSIMRILSVRSVKISLRHLLSIQMITEAKLERMERCLRNFVRLIVSEFMETFTTQSTRRDSLLSNQRIEFHKSQENKFGRFCKIPS